MEVQDAVRLAKDYVRRVYADEEVANVGLEEVRLDSDVWHITIGFSRPWDDHKGYVAKAQGLPPIRSYKIVDIDDGSGVVVSMKAREVARSL